MLLQNILVVKNLKKLVTDVSILFKV